MAMTFELRERAVKNFKPEMTKGGLARNRGTRGFNLIRFKKNDEGMQEESAALAIQRTCYGPGEETQAGIKFIIGLAPTNRS